MAKKLNFQGVPPYIGNSHVKLKATYNLIIYQCQDLIGNPIGKILA